MLYNFTKQFYFLNLCRIIILLSILFCPSIAISAEIVTVQSINIKPYNDALNGFKSACDCDVERLIVSEMEGADIAKKVREVEPDIIIAIGIDALNRVKSIKNTPIVYLMILNPQSVISDEENITGISMNIAPEKQLSVLSQALPDVKKVGLLYNPEKTGYFAKKAKLAAAAIGIDLIVREVYSSKNIPALLQSMEGEINAFWMLPDITVVTPETVEFLLLFSFENRIPVITFSDKYVEMGALISLDIDAHDIGKQAWEMTEKILSGTNIKEFPKTDARKAEITINLKTAKKLGITVSNEILNKSKVINKE